MVSPQYAAVQFRVRYGETDQMGVVYHTNYLNWMEIGRTNYLRDAALSYRELEEKGLLLPLTDASVSFKAPARYDDMVEVRTWVLQVTPVRLDFAYEVYRACDGQLLVSGVTKHVFTNREFKPLRVNRFMPELYEWLLAQQGGDDQ